jgi:hypothetical protein
MFSRLFFKNYLAASDHRLSTKYLENGTFFKAETFTISYGPSSLNTGKIASRTSIILISREYLRMHEKFSNTVTVFERSSRNPNPFGIFITVMSSNYRPKFIEIGVGHSGRFPRALGG